MPYFNQSILEREFNRKDVLRAGVPWKLLSFSFIVFLTSIGIFLGMEFGFKPYLNLQIKNLDSKLNEVAGSVSEEEKKNFLTFYSQVVNVNQALASRRLASKIFDFLEKNTLKDVYFINFYLNYEEKEIRAEGRVSSFGVLAQQMEVFKQSPSLAAVALESARLEEGKNSKVRFSIRLKLKQ